MRTNLFIASALALVLAVGDNSFSDTVKKAKPTVTPKAAKTESCCTECQLCCTSDECCEECVLCCSIDGCCEECMQCCIEMGCDASCCLPALTGAKTKTPKTTEACCTKAVKKAAKACCGDGCCK